MFRVNGPGVRPIARVIMYMFLYAIRAGDRGPKRALITNLPLSHHTTCLPMLESIQGWTERHREMMVLGLDTRPTPRTHEVSRRSCNGLVVSGRNAVVLTCWVSEIDITGSVEGRRVENVPHGLFAHVVDKMVMCSMRNMKNGWFTWHRRMTINSLITNW